MFLYYSLIVSLLSLSSCSHLYSVQLGDIEDREGSYENFEIKVSEVGINTEEAGQVIDTFSGRDEGSTINDIIELFQQGPRTGNPVYNEKYAENIHEVLLKKCPDGRVSNLTSVREARKYPVISGEIIKITGTCFRKGH